MPQPSHVVVFDFDGTLISKHRSLFDVMDRALSPEDCQKIDFLRHKYLPLLSAGQTLCTKEAAEMITIPIEIYTKAGLTLYKIAKTLSIVDLRPGVEETLHFLAQKEIPTAIISYGITAFIESVLENQKVRSRIAKVYAAELITKDGLLCGYRPETIVTVATKGVCSKNFADRHGVPLENILAVGDSPADQFLGGLQENRLGIAKDQAEKEKIAPYFGEIVLTENFSQVLEWLKIKLDKTLS